MKLSRESQYGLDGLAYLAQQEEGAVLSVAEISEKADLPRAFLAKIFRKLANHGILQSLKGKQRGFRLLHKPEELSIKEIIKAIEGPDYFTRCIFWNGRCSDVNPCILHEIQKNVMPRAAEQLEALSLEDVIKRNLEANSAS